MSYPKDHKDFYFFQPLNADRENLYIRGGWSKLLEKAIAESGVTAIFVNYWSGRDLNFLRQFRNQIRRLEVEESGIEDISAINELTLLETLGVHYRPYEDIDFSRLTRLRECSLGTRVASANIGECENLEHLTLIAMRTADLKLISPLRKLKFLALQEIPLRSLAGIEGLGKLEKLFCSQVGLSDLRGIEACSKLRDLTLAYMRRLTSIDSITALRGLEVLSLESCHKIQDLMKTIEQLSSLRGLELSQMGDIPSLKPLSRLRKLENLFFWERTIIRDGDLKPLLHLPRLRRLGFLNRRHYSHKLEELHRLLNITV